MPHHPLIGFASFLRQLSSPLERFLVAGSSVVGPFKCGTRHQSFGHQHIVIFVIIKTIDLTYCYLRVSIIITVSVINISIAYSIMKH